MLITNYDSKSSEEVFENQMESNGVGFKEDSEIIVINKEQEEEKGNKNDWDSCS